MQWTTDVVVPQGTQLSIAVDSSGLNSKIAIGSNSYSGMSSYTASLDQYTQCKDGYTYNSVKATCDVADVAVSSRSALKKTANPKAVKITFA